VKQTFYVAAGMAAAGMLAVFLASQVAAVPMMRVFTSEAAVISVGEEYLRIVSWSYVASGVIFVTSSMFQALGNTIPSLISSFTRIVGTAVPVLFLSRVPGFSLRWVWLLSAVTVFAQMTLSLLLLRREFRRRLAFAGDATAPTAPV
jgi:Na+-driven multidrug efflux pump